MTPIETPKGASLNRIIKVMNCPPAIIIMEPKGRKPLAIHFVSSVDSPEFTHLTRSLSRSSVIGLDAEWKPQNHTLLSTFPTVSLLQIACRLAGDDSNSLGHDGSSLVFLLDLLEIPLPSIYELLRDVFVSPQILKLGFRFKQDLVYLSSTFCSQDCNPGFHTVEPYLDITSIYSCLRHKQPGRKLPRECKSLATICEEVLNISLSKELQCSDWSQRPLSEEQKAYTAADAHCLLEIFTVFQVKVSKAENSFHKVTKLQSPKSSLGVGHILEKLASCKRIMWTQFCKALEAVRGIASEFPQSLKSIVKVDSRISFSNKILMDDSLLHIVEKYADKVLLKESDRNPKTSRKKGKKVSHAGPTCRKRQIEITDNFEGPPPWDLSVGGDGSPKFLCDVMVEGLAKHLRCVGIDAAIPNSRKPETRELIDQADKEKRVLLTRDAKLLRHEYLIKNQIYRVKSLLKNEQLLEVIETFQLKINQDQLMSRCTKCNGRFIQKPLTTEEAIEAAKGFQVIPSCLFDKNLEFWQCMDCNQLYWEDHSCFPGPRQLSSVPEAFRRHLNLVYECYGVEGTQYHNAVQKFIDVCKLKD